MCTTWLFFLATLWVSGGAGKEVTLPGVGTLEGTTTQSSWTNRTIFQYQGIPFVEPPVGNLRFRRPVPYARQWKSTFNATEFGPVCPQQGQAVPAELGRQDEDCLHLNVYTTKTDGGGVGRGRPVMVFFHGGVFRVGSSRNILPNFLLEEDILLVVPQYRLGPLGFLSLKTEEMPGNQGFLDMIEALRWVKKYIEYFGGDPDSVTLFGQSAGGAAASLMLFSPLVEDGLIQRIIVQSGTALAPWLIDHQPIAYAREYGAVANCSQPSLTDLARCLRDDKSVKQLLDAYTAFLDKDKIAGFRAVLNEAGNKSFLVKDPNFLWKQGKFKHIPLMGGVTKHESSFLVANMYDRYRAVNLTHSEEFLKKNLTRYTLEFLGITDDTGYIADFTREQYFTDEDFKHFSTMAAGLMDITGSALVKHDTIKIVSKMSQYVPSYLYSFNYLGRFSSYGYFSTFGQGSDYWRYPFPAGVAHGDELLYIFPQNYAILNTEETNMAKKMVQFWTSFAANGVPSATGAPVWPAVSTGKGPYMKIEAEPVVQSNFMDEYFTAVRATKTSGKSSGNIHPGTHASILTLIAVLALCIQEIIC